jgi:hypothetical protein
MGDFYALAPPKQTLRPSDMGEAKLKFSATQKLINEYPLCCFCGGVRASTTREHMPPIALFDNSHRPNQLVSPACAECNGGTSTADLTIALVSRWDYNNTSQEQLDHKRLAHQAKKQAPELLAEWTKFRTDSQRMNARLHLIKHGVEVPHDAGMISIGPLTIRQLNLFAHKATLALYFEHFKKPLSDTGRIYANWRRPNEDFACAGISQELLQMFPEYGTLVQGKWDEGQTFEYRHAKNRLEGLFGYVAKFRKGLFILGFAVEKAEIVPFEPMNWIKPSELLSSINSSRFGKKL